MTTEDEPSDPQTMTEPPESDGPPWPAELELVVWLAQMVAAMPSILGRPVADQDRPYVAVVQDGATPAPRAGKPQRAAAVSTSAVITDLGWVN